MMKRREFIKAIVASGALTAPEIFADTTSKVNMKAIPSTGEMLPVIGLGSFVTYNFPQSSDTISQRSQLIDNFFSLGGKLIDSSPMYGSSEKNLGLTIESPKTNKSLFSATKVWTSSIPDGIQGIETSKNLWQVDQFDLLQVHNLLSWQGHLETLFKMKQAGELRYVGITTSHGRRHSDIEHVMLNYPVDFVQATYNIHDREIEQRILPVAKERGIAVIVNRPFQRGSLIDWANNQPLPDFAKEIQCDNWASLLLKYVVSHPAVTCAIPATSQIEHLVENMSAQRGQMPDEAMRTKIQQYVASL